MMRTSHILSGLAAVVNLGGGDDYLDRRAAALVVNLGESGSRFAGGTRTGALLTLEHALEQAADYAQNANAFERNQHPGYDYSVPDLEALAAVLAGDTAVLAAVHRAADIESLIRLAGEYSLRVILLGASEAWMLADEIAAAGIPVILAPMSNLPSNFDMLNARGDAAGILADAGVRIAFAGPQSTTHNARNITQSAGNAGGLRCRGWLQAEHLVLGRLRVELAAGQAQHDQRQDAQAQQDGRDLKRAHGLPPSDSM